MKLFELRACWEEFYDCPDNGKTKICDTYETIAFAIDDDAHLKTIADDLAKGFGRGCWNETRAKALRRLYPGYDCHRDTEYKTVEVTDLIIVLKGETP
jgi:hypothetical protein